MQPFVQAVVHAGQYPAVEPHTGNTAALLAQSVNAVSCQWWPRGGGHVGQSLVLFSRQRAWRSTPTDFPKPLSGAVYSVGSDRLAVKRGNFSGQGCCTQLDAAVVKGNMICAPISSAKLTASHADVWFCCSKYVCHQSQNCACTEYFLRMRAHFPQKLNLSCFLY